MKSEKPKTDSSVISVLVGIILSLLPLPLAAQQINRTVLPVPEPQPPTITELDARNAKAPPRFEVKAPKGAANVVVVLLDDIGFGQSSAFGGPCKMPTLDKLADRGLRYNNFHTTALCSPTRTALLTGRNHHVNHAGAIMELATAFPEHPNGAEESVAAVCNPRGNVLAILPHPERAQDLGAVPRQMVGPWPEARSRAFDDGAGGAEAVDDVGPGLRLFEGLRRHLVEV